MKLLLLLSLVGLAVADCPSGMVYNAQFNKCYKYVSQASAYFLAEQDCFSIGGHLASIHSGFENALIAENAANAFGTGNFWIGANQVMSGSWGWTDGSNFTYSNWGPGQPVSNTSQCVNMSPQTAQWTSSYCSNGMKYVCALDVSAAPTPKPCPTQPPHVGYCESGWTYFTYTDSCYKVLIGDAFNDAESTCIASQAHLTSIHSSQENTFVAELAATGLTLDWNGMTWLGMHKVNGDWANLDGTPVDYYNWSPGNPDNNKGDENCIQLIQDELSGKDHTGFRMGWNDIVCDESLRAFACKKAALH